jgi:hypothetical protein
MAGHSRNASEPGRCLSMDAGLCAAANPVTIADLLIQIGAAGRRGCLGWESRGCGCARRARMPGCEGFCRHHMLLSVIAVRHSWIALSSPIRAMLGDISAVAIKQV